jgi:hypothetical protein
LFTFALALPLAMGACGGANDADETPEIGAQPSAETTPPAATTPAPTDMQPMTADFTGLNDSPASGTLQLRPTSATQTEVVVNLQGFAAAGAHEGHIHMGTCAAPGQVVAPLQPVNVDAAGAGTSTSTVDQALMSIADGNHIVAYHAAGGDPGAPVVCAAIPAHTM